MLSLKHLLKSTNVGAVFKTWRRSIRTGLTGSTEGGMMMKRTVARSTKDQIDPAAKETKSENNIKPGNVNDIIFENKALLLPITYILNVPGKDISSKWIRAFNYWFDIPEDKLLAVEEVMRTLHTAFLVLDDIEDNSCLRRGVPVAHKVYGVPSSINAANYAFCLALEMCSKMGHPDAVNVWIEQQLEIHRGQGMELYWRDNFVCPKEEEYCEMTKKKTGAFFMLPIKLMQLFSENKTDVSKFIGTMGMHFQIIDDYLNLCSKEYHQNKTYCEDLTEGKFSFPIIHAIQQEPDDNRVMNILKQRTTDNDLKRYCVTILEECGSFEYTRKKLAELAREASEEIKVLGHNPDMDVFLAQVFKTD